MPTKRRKSRSDLTIKLDRSRPPIEPQPWADVRRSKTELKRAREKLAGKSTDTRPDLQSFAAHRIEHDFQLRYKRAFQHGDFSALLDFIAARGVAAIRREWVVRALERHEKRARGDVNALRLPVAGTRSRNEDALSDAKAKARRAQSTKLLRAVGRALASVGSGRTKIQTVHLQKQIAAAYARLLAKVRAVVAAIREALPDIEEMTPEERAEVARGYSKRFDLPAELCGRIVAYHLPGAPHVRRSPSWVAKREIARQFQCGTRAVERAITAARRTKT